MEDSNFCAKIIPLDESEFDHCIDNIHFNSIGSACEFILDKMVTKKLRELTGNENVHVETDFDYFVKDNEVVSMVLSLWFGGFLKRDAVLDDFHMEALTNTLKNVFETDDVSLKKEKEVAYWTIDDKKRMLWFIGKLNELGISTKETFNVTSSCGDSSSN